MKNREDTGVRQAKLAHIKPAKPARPKANHQAGTELCARGGNELREAIGKERVSHNESEGIKPRNNHHCIMPRGDAWRGQGFPVLETRSVTGEKVSPSGRAGV